MRNLNSYREIMPPKTVTPIKASESVASRMLAKILKVQQSDSLAEVCTAYVDDGAGDALKGLIGEVYELYPWIVNVAAEVMAERTTPMTEYLMAMPGSVFVLKDSAHAGQDSLWLAIGDPRTDQLLALRSFVCRGLLHTHRLPDGSLAQIIAIQLNSYRP